MPASRSTPPDACGRRAPALWLAAVALLAWPVSALGADSAYVTASGSSEVFQYDVATSGALAPKTPASIPAGASPQGVAVSPDGRSVYVADNLSPRTVSQYDAGADGTLTPKSPATVAAGAGPVGVAVSPDGRSVYVTTTSDNHLSQYDAGAGGALTPKSPATVGAGGGPRGVAVSPDGRSVYVANSADGTLSQYDVGAGGALTPKGARTVVAGSRPINVTIGPGGASVYVTNSADGTISQYDVGAGGGLTPKSPRIVSAGGNPVGVALGPDGASAYTTDGSHGDVLQYDVSEAGALSPNSRGSVLAGMGPVGVALRPDQGPVASFSMTPASVGSATGFDGSASSDSDGSVARYDWSFGDGVSAADAGPRPTHTYGAAGLYSVRLTVTDDSRCSTAQVFTGQTAYCDGGPAAIATRTLVVPVSTAGPTPYLSSLSLRPSSLRAAPSGPSVAATRTRTGSTLAYADSQAATTFFLVKRGKAGIRRGTACVPRPAGRRGGRLCTRLITLGGFTHHDRAGANRLHFTGRLRGRKLAPGVYELTATPSAAGRVGGTLARLFRILR